jgi:hypothetical protein
MSELSESYLKVPYDLRPAKQIERRMFVDGLLKLALAGFPIQTYQYTGMGSIHFIDFILFHKLLGIKNLLSVEYSTGITQRISFNKPFANVRIEMKPMSEVIPTLDPAITHIVWLDYDHILNTEDVQDIQDCGTLLPKKSILLVTLDVKPPEEMTIQDSRQHFLEHAGTFVSDRIDDVQFTQAEWPNITRDVVVRALNRTLAPRDLEFIPLFSFLYADGHEMLTLGGMLGGEDEKSKIAQSLLVAEDYYCENFDAQAYRIRVPILTRKERLHLDRAMPCADGWLPDDFEISKEDLLIYRSIYRFLPIYAEFLV